jgi:ferritin-like metal-binding protein YciE
MKYIMIVLCILNIFMMFSYYRLVNQNKNLTEEFDKKMKETQDYQKNLEFIIGLKNKGS